MFPSGRGNHGPTRVRSAPRAMGDGRWAQGPPKGFMERGSITKWLFLAVAAFLFFQFGFPLIFGSGSSTHLVFEGLNDAKASPQQAEEQVCTLKGTGFEALLSTRGASLKHLRLTGNKYTLT